MSYLQNNLYQMFGNKTLSSVSPTHQNNQQPKDLNSRIKKVDVLLALNDVTDDLLSNGYNMSQKLVNKIKYKNSFDMGDVQALSENLKKQDRGDYKHINYEHLCVSKDSNLSKSVKSYIDTMKSDAQKNNNNGSSSYDMKMITYAQDGMKIVVKNKF